MKLHTFIDIFITDHVEPFSGPVIEIGVAHRTDCKFEFWFVNSPMVIIKTQKFDICWNNLVSVFDKNFG